MKNIDVEYLCTTLGNLTGIPVRIYEDNIQTFYHSVVRLPKDPIIIHLEQILKIQEHIGYFFSEQFIYYGIINFENKKIVIGPSRQESFTIQEIKEMIFQADVQPDDINDFISGMKCIVPMPIVSLLQALCTLNYVLNDEKKTIEDLTIQQEPKKVETEAIFSDEPAYTVHNTYDMEEMLLGYIRKGDIVSLTNWISNAPALSAGSIASDHIRQIKNTFIVTATLASRAAIRGGMDINDAFTCSDAYIQKCELSSSPEAIMTLQYQMILDFTEKVNRLRNGENPSQLVLDVKNYIWHHMSNPITTEDIAKELHMSRTYLSKRFKQETNENLVDCILREKIEESKKLLRYTDKSLSSISLYLGFSSQSHFSRVFRKFNKVSPLEYRQKYTK